MAYIEKAEFEQIKKIDVLSFMKRFRPSELVLLGNGVYCTRTHDSLKISNGKWMWWSRGIGGKNALDYLVNVEGFRFYDAVMYLKQGFGISGFPLQKTDYYSKERKEKSGFCLPEPADSNEKIIEYLKHRGISDNVIQFFIEKKMIYQTKSMNNIVFVGFNSFNEPRYASIRGTGEEKYFCEPANSDKSFSFKLINNDSDQLHVFEGAIDLLSYATISERKGKDFEQINMLSLGGVAENSSRLPAAIEAFLREHQGINSIHLHLDNDGPGRKAAECITKLLSEKYQVYDSPVPYGKDVNEYLQKTINKERGRER